LVFLLLYLELMYKILLAGIISLAFLLRVVSISSYPIGLNPDEASFGYDAYSLLKTGKDQWGQSWPLTLRSFGDFKLSLYAYLTIPSVAVFGLNEFGVRLPNSIFGTLAVLATYLFTRKLFKDPKISIVASFLLAVSPWHIPLSRGAFEANLTTFFLPLGVWAFLKGKDKQRWMIVSALLFGLNLFSYHSARLVTPLLVLVLVLWKSKELSGSDTLIHAGLSRHRWAIIAFLIFLFVAGYTMLTGAGSRGADIAIFNPTDRWTAVADRRYEALLQGFPDSLARVFSNKIVYTFEQFVGRYLTYLSPKFLFMEGPAEWTYGMIPGRGVLYLIELPFLLTAVWMAMRGRVPALGILFLWILLAPIPAALAKGSGFAANRAAIMMPALEILSAYGAIVLYDLLVNKWRDQWVKRFLRYGFVVLLLTSLAFFLEDYKYHAPIRAAEAMHYGKREAVEFVKSVEENYTEIVFSRSLSEPHIYVAFYNKWAPLDYQGETPDWLRYERERRSFLDQLGEYRLGKYVFRSIDYTKDKTAEGILLVGKPNEFPEGVHAVKKVLEPDGKLAILVVDPQK